MSLEPTPEQVSYMKENWSTTPKLQIAKHCLVSTSTLYRWAELLGLFQPSPSEEDSIQIRSHKRRRLRPPILPIFSRPAFFEEDLQSIVVGGGRYRPLSGYYSEPKF
jgi:hypothetical protein